MKNQYTAQCWKVAFFAAAMAIVPAFPVSAQSDPRLVSAVHLAQAGRMDSARAIVRRLLSSLSQTDPVYPEALYVSGVLAQDPQTVATNLQRVVIEYGQSPWADDALLRLAQLYAAQNDDAATIRAVERLRRDYPESPHLAKVNFTGARAYFTLKDDARGCELIRETLNDTTSDVEFRNQVQFYAARCTAVAAVAKTPVIDSTAAAGPKTYAVQVLAVRSSSQVDEMLTRLKVMGYEARVVRDSSGLFKVRVGKYTDRDQAQKTLTNLRTRLGGQPFVVEEP